MITNKIRYSLIAAAFILGLSVILSVMDNTTLLSEEGARRIMQIVIGLGLAAYGNYMPKETDSVRQTARAMQARRISGWSLVISGLIFASLWAFAPVAVAETWSTVAVASAVVLMGAYCLWCLVRPTPSA